MFRRQSSGFAEYYPSVSLKIEIMFGFKLMGRAATDWSMSALGCSMTSFES